MCGFIGTSKKIDNLKEVNRFCKNRGPDKTNLLSHNGVNFVHNLLSITGEFKTQPLISECGNIFCVYNGEIYNYKSFGDYKSDGYCIIPLYEEYGEAFASKLDGEFAVSIIDFSKNKIILTTDCFGTKPLWFSSQDGDFAFASYESCIKSLDFSSYEKIPANTTLTIDMSSLQQANKKKVFNFEINQHKDYYDDWIIAFHNALNKRCGNVREKCFIGLSGGYDSGAIACGLNELDLKYKAYSIPGAENKTVLDARKKLIKDMEIIDIQPEQFLYEKDFLQEECEDFTFMGKCSARCDKASAGLSLICRIASKRNYKIYISGQGADEIMSDYGINGIPLYGPGQLTQFAGRFPENLKDLFPWVNFFGGMQEKYIGKEESVAGSHGIETRYPFLDVNLVQEFLWLKSGLKNRQYKAPIDDYMSNHSFPFTRNEKVGFRPNHSFKNKKT